MTNKVILVIGGDHRYIYAVNRLAAHQHTIYTIGFKGNTFHKENIFSTSMEDIDLQNITHIVLPVEGMSSSFQISCHFTGEKVRITEEMLSSTKKNCELFTGTANEQLRGLANKVGRKLVVLFERDDVAIYNSIPTAEAVLQIMMEKTNITVHGANVAVTGFGRVGMTIATLFQKVGANVTVAVRKDADAARAIESGLQVCAFNHLKDIAANMDVWVNTVPVLVLGREVVGAMKEEALIIDVASNPGGTDFVAAGELGIRAIHALGLPGEVAPKTAGDIIADTILRA